MGYFDYSPPQVPDQAEGLAALGDAVTGIIKRRQQQKQFEEEQATKNLHEQRSYSQQQRQYDLMNRSQARLEGRQAADVNMKQAEEKRKALNEIERAASDHNMQKAQGIAAGTVTYDPATGEERGRASISQAPLPDRGPEPTAPQSLPPEVLARRRGAAAAAEAPYRPLSEGPQPDPGAFVGPIPSNEESWRSNAETAPERDATLAARQGYEGRAAAAADQAKQDAAAESDFARASAAFPGEQGAYQAQRKMDEMNRPFSVTMGPGEAPVTFDPATQRYAQRTAAADDFMESLRGVNLGPNGQNAAARAHAAILAGADPQKVFRGFDEEMKLGVKADYGEQLQGQKDVAAKERAQISASKPPTVFQARSLDERKATGTRQDLSELRKEFADWERNVQLPLDSKSFKRLNTALANLKSGNGMMQREGAEGLVGFFRGGVVTGQAQKYLLSHLSGLGGQAETALENIKSGQYGESDLAVLQEAASNAVNEQAAKADLLYKSAVGRMGPGSGFDAYGGNVNAKVLGMLRQFGYEAPPVYPGAEAVPLGSNERPYNKKKGRRGIPEVDAKDKGKTKSPVDEALQ